MAVPIFVGGAGNVTTQQRVGASSATFGKPAGTVEGDLMICFLPVYYGINITAPTGWTRSTVRPYIADAVNGIYLQAQFYYKFATATEPTTYAFYSSASTVLSGLMCSIRGAAATNPFEVMTAGTSTTAAHLALPAITTKSTDNKVMSFGVMYSYIGDPGGNFTFPPPSGYGLIEQLSAGGLLSGYFHRDAAAAGVIAAAQATVPGAPAGSRSISMTLAITPGTPAVADDEVAPAGVAITASAGAATAQVMTLVAPAGAATTASAGDAVALFTGATAYPLGLAMTAMGGTAVIEVVNPLSPVVAPAAAAMAFSLGAVFARVVPYREEQPYESNRDSILVHPAAVRPPNLPADFETVADDQEMTYLQISQRVQQLCAISGAKLASVGSATGELKRVTDWVNDAWLSIQTLHPDWLFMKTGLEFLTETDVSNYTPARMGIAVPQRFDLFSFTCYGDVQDESVVWFLNEDEFRYRYRFGQGRAARGKPAHFTVAANRTLTLAPTPDGGYTVTGRAFMRPYLLAADTDVPVMPYAYHMAIVYRAMMFYGAYEAASDVYQHAEREYTSLIMKARAECLPAVAFADTTLA
jgi:hypothetical protein